MTNYRRQYNFTFTLQLKIESDTEHIRHCLLFCFP